MKKGLLFFAMALAGGFVSLSAYKLLIEDTSTSRQLETPSNFPVYSTNYAAIPLADGMADFTSAAERTVNSVVHVKTQSTVQPAFNPWSDFFGYNQDPRVQTASGSGVIISTDGYIITNNHVVEGAEKLSVTLNNNKNYDATIVGRDPSSDIAVIKINEKDLPAISWGNSDDVRIGQWVIAVGNPFELTSTVTAGIVSAKARNINLLGSGNTKSGDVFPIESFIQTDAAVNPGNSGGALVNTQGELIGINTAIASRTGTYSGYSFAVPTSIARKISNDIIEFGNVQRAFIGVRISEVSQDIAKEKGLKDVAGIYVNEVTDGGAASYSGIKQGDIIQKVGDAIVRNVPQLQEQIARYRPGDKVKVTVWRDGKSQVEDMTLRNRNGKPQLEDFAATAAEEADASAQTLGATFTLPSDSDLSKLKISGGAKVAELGPGKFKSLGLQKGFIITKIDGIAINSPNDVANAINGKAGKYVEIRGYYSNGMEAMYGFRL